METTQVNSQSAQTPDFLSIVKSALRAKGRLPATGRRPHRGNVTGFELIARPGGWAAVLTFEDGRAGSPASIYPSAKEAFMTGAETLCGILTGSTTLPFFIDHGDNLVVAGYGTGGFEGFFLLKMPAPWRRFSRTADMGC